MIDVFCARLLLRVALLLLWVIPIASLSASVSDGKRYVVKKNDTLTDIARKHGVSVRALMERNHLDQPDKIYEGKVLRIPSPGTPPGRPILDANVRKRLDQVLVVPKKWKYIVIHHSATDSGTAAGMDRYHRDERHMENGLAYHFVIGNGHGMPDGEIFIGKRWSDQLDGGHLASEALNAKSIGICLVGNFDQDRPTDKQMGSLEALVSDLMKRCRLSAGAVKTHQQINPIYTRCPGSQFPSSRFLRALRRVKAADARAERDGVSGWFVALHSDRRASGMCRKTLSRQRKAG